MTPAARRAAACRPRECATRAATARRRVRPRIPEAPEPHDRRADQQEIAVRQAMRRLEEYPGAVAASQVADEETITLPGDPRVQRGQEGIVREADVTDLPADRHVGPVAVEALRHVSGLVEQHESDRASAPPRPP